jgi:hypothetical protein
MTVDAPRTPGRAAFAFIFVTVLLDMLALGIVLPVLPKLIKAFMGGDTAGASSIVGWFGAAWALMQFIFQPVLGCRTGSAAARWSSCPIGAWGSTTSLWRWPRTSGFCSSDG